MSKQIFKSANPKCNKDYIDGYPAVKDEFTFNTADFSFVRGTDDQDIADGLGLPSAPTTDTALFKLGSGVLLDNDDPEYRFYEGMRLDCGCLLYDCDDEDATGQLIALR